MRPVPAIHQEDELVALERAILEACADVDRSVAALMKALYEFEQKEGYLRVGQPSFAAWLESDRFPYDRSTGHQLRKIYETFVVEGGLDAEAVARAGWTKLHRLERLVAQDIVTPVAALDLASSRTQKEVAEEARWIRGGQEQAASRLPLFDVRIKVGGSSLYLHKRVREESANRAAWRARQSFGKEDLFGLEFGKQTVKEIDE